MKPIIIAAASSGSGKTTFTTGLLRVLGRMGLDVRPFKTGPDYIDTAFHKFASGKPSYNLDTWMIDERGNCGIFYKHTQGADAAVIEGVMGLFDGKDDSLRGGSTASLAELLGVPVLLLVDTSGLSQSVAALISGFKNFNPAVNIVGVVLNNVGSASHYEMLRGYIHRTTGVECFGYLGRDAGIRLESRHLGLVGAAEITDRERLIDRIADNIAEHCDIGRLLDAIADYDFSKIKTYLGCVKPIPKRELTVGVASDEAFNFYYDDNLELMEEAGVKLVRYSPIHDSKLPDSIDGLYLGGGYPELYGDLIERNISMRDDLLRAVGNGLPVYAECGGLIYLTDSVTGIDGVSHKMTGVFNCRTEMTDRLHRFGYVEVETCGVRVRGHEFHYSRVVENGVPDYKFRYRVLRGDREWSCGLAKGNVIAGYPHIHFYANRDFLDLLLNFYQRKVSFYS